MLLPGRSGHLAGKHTNPALHPHKVSSLQEAACVSLYRNTALRRPSGDGMRCPWPWRWSSETPRPSAPRLGSCLRVSGSLSCPRPAPVSACGPSPSAAALLQAGALTGPGEEHQDSLGSARLSVDVALAEKMTHCSFWGSSKSRVSIFLLAGPLRQESSPRCFNLTFWSCRVQ